MSANEANKTVNFQPGRSQVTRPIRKPVSRIPAPVKKTFPSYETMKETTGVNHPPKQKGGFLSKKWHKEKNGDEVGIDWDELHWGEIDQSYLEDEDLTEEEKQVMKNGLQSYNVVHIKKASLPKKDWTAENARAVVVTDFHLGWWFWYEYAKQHCDYFIGGNEICPDTGRQHIQIYMHFKSARRFKTVLNDVNPCFVQVAYRDDYKSDYEEKEGSFVEWGKKPSQGERNDLVEIQKRMREDRAHPDIVADEKFGTWCKYHKAFEQYWGTLNPKRMWEKYRGIDLVWEWGDSFGFYDLGYKIPRCGFVMPKVTCIYGAPGGGENAIAEGRGGKSHEALMRGAKMLMLSGTDSNPFIQNYAGEPVVCFNDFIPCKANRTWLLNITDRYDIAVNIKGGEMPWNPIEIIFTCNEDPHMWFEGDAAWLRRVTEWIYLGEDMKCSAPSQKIPSTKVATGQTDGIGASDLARAVRYVMPGGDEEMRLQIEAEAAAEEAQWEANIRERQEREVQREAAGMRGG